MPRIVFLCLLLVSCASQPTSRTELTSGQDSFILTDQSGKYIVRREVKIDNKKLVTRVQIFNTNQTSQPLESSVAVSQIGSVRKSKVKALLPEASQFLVWLEKNKYTSNLVADKKTKKFRIKTESPEEKWNGIKEFDIPKGRYFCFFSQLPDCLIMQNILLLARKQKVSLYVIWDNFPFYSEQYEGLSGELLTLADFYFSQKDSDSLRFELDLGNQIIFYHFDKQLKFEKLFWVSQGVSMVRSDGKEVKEKK